MDINKFVGEKIRHYRKLTGMNQSKLAEKLGVSQQALGLLENGKRKVSPEVFVILRSELNVSIDDFFPKDEG